MPESNHFIGWYIKKTCFQYKVSMKLIENKVGSGYSLSEHKVQIVLYINPIVYLGLHVNFVSMDDP